ncbi:hypothetical protein [Agarilytica rhodophyticola]|uniref:hypothetical protein n=1 Tax=Agarilytica rhodophyticola TaxID=1737490 RepID=UPI000B342CD6|nr:hypothetical protein [Agarilytica rhodophyticola]
MIDLDVLNERLIHHNCVISLRMDMQTESLKYNLLLTLSESEDTTSNKLTLCFYDISDLQISEFGGGLTQFMHLSITCLDSGFDRVNYVLKDKEHEKISFNFASVDDFS